MRILVVDDNRPFCDNLKDILELKGHQATTAYDGASAIEAAGRSPPDVVLLDVVMSQMNGLEAFRKIRAIAPAARVIMMTGFSMENLTGQALLDGVYGVLKKPLDFDQLFALLEDKHKE